MPLLGQTQHTTTFTPARSWGRWLLRMGLSCALTLLPLMSGAADENAPDLRVLKAQLRRELLTAALSEQKVYREALLALEKKHADAQDFASALRTREERSRLEQEIASMEKELSTLASSPRSSGSPAPGRIEMKPSEASLTGLKLETADGALNGWETAGASAVWKLPNLPPGGYEVILVHLGGPVTALLKESFYTLTAELKENQGKPKEQNLGTLRIKDGAGTLTLTLSLPEKSTGVRVYSLLLVPCAR